jgi:hypothetical protein
LATEEAQARGAQLQDELCQSGSFDQLFMANIHYG